DPNELLVSKNGDAGEAFRKLLDEAEPAVPAPSPAALPPADTPPAAPAAASAEVTPPVPARAPPAPAPVAPAPIAGAVTREDGQLVRRMGEVTYRARVYAAQAGR